MKCHLLTGAGVPQSQIFGVKYLMSDMMRLLECAVPSPVDKVAHERMPDIGKMHPYLMSPSRLKAASDAGEAHEPLTDLKVSYCVSCLLFRIAYDRHLLSVVRITAYRGVDSTRIFSEASDSDRAVGASHTVILKLSR